jgi:hypothetical protein
MKSGQIGADATPPPEQVVRGRDIDRDASLDGRTMSARVELNPIPIETAPRGVAVVLGRIKGRFA